MTRAVRIERIEAADDPRLDEYRIVRDPELVRRSDRFLAEGRLVVRTLLVDSPLTACSVLCDETALGWLEGDVGEAVPNDVPVYVTSSGLKEVGGWKFHQGCLALGERPPQRAVPDVLSAVAHPRLVVGLDGVTNPDNVGAIFRTASAFGADAVVLSPECASPLYRKAVRTSMGAALRLPFVHGPAWRESLEALHAVDFDLLALAPADAEPLEDVAAHFASGTRRALLMGAEGPGLSATSFELADRRVGIPMPGGIDSLNVAAAAAVALYRLSR